MSLIPVIDRIPTLPGRWLVTHEDNSTEYVTVTRADEPTEVGSAINRVLFNKLQDAVDIETTFNANGSITETSATVTTVTTFNADGSITEVATDTSGNTMTRTTEFNADGSITITMS